MSVIEVEDRTAEATLLSEAQRDAVSNMADRARSAIDGCHPPAVLLALVEATVKYAAELGISARELAGLILQARK